MAPTNVDTDDVSSEPAAMSRTEALGRRSARRAPLVSAILASALVATGLGIWALRPGTPVATVLPPSAGSAVAPAAVPVPGDLRTGAMVPSLDAPGLRPGEPAVNLAADRGQPVVLNFFASWCHPCKAELPLLRAAWQKTGTKVHFVGVDVNDSRANALKLVAADHVGYQLAADASGSVAVRFGLLNLPDTVFLDAQGRIVHTQVGQLTPKILDTWLGRLGG